MKPDSLICLWVRGPTASFVFGFLLRAVVRSAAACLCECACVWGGKEEEARRKPQKENQIPRNLINEDED